MNDDGRWMETEKRARALFDASVESIDGATRSRLNQARQLAVDASRPDLQPRWTRWLPAAAAACVASVAIVLWRAPVATEPSPGVDAGALPRAAVVELLATSEGFEVASVDPEFDDWLETRGMAATDGAG